MSSIVYMKSKNSDKVYVYVNEKTGSGYSRRCIGHLDKVTGEIVPNKERGGTPTVMTRSYGINTLLRRISDDIGLSESIQIIFKDSWDSIMTLAFYSLCEGSHITGLERWMEFNESPRMWPLSIDQVNSIMKDITQERIESFFRVWKNKMGDHEYVVTSISTERSTNKESKNDFEKEFSTEIQMCFGRDSGLPVAYSIHPTKYRSVTEMATSLDWMEWLNGSGPSFFFTLEQTGEIDVDSIIGTEHDYLLELPPKDNLFARTLDGFSTDRKGYSIEMDADRREIHGIDVDVYLFYDPMKAEIETSRFLEIMNRCKFELDNQHYVASHSSLYNRYFLFRGRGDCEFNSEEIMKHNKEAGYRIFMTNRHKDRSQVLRMVERVDYFREMFEKIKGDEDISAIKLYTASVLKSRFFIQFLATILGERLRRMISDAELNETVESVLYQMKCMIRVDRSDRKRPLMSDMNEHQREILDKLLFNTT